MAKLVPRREALKVLNVCYKTLYKMAENKEIEAVKIGGTTRYNIEKYLKEKKINEVKDKVTVCYCRVSSAKQKEDLKRQIKYMKEKYPDYEIMWDIGSGINFERKNLQKILKLAIEGKIEKIIVAYKDRLARIGYELIEWIVKEYSQGKIKIINKDEEETPAEELTKDIIQIMNVYVAKVNGLRKYQKKMEKKIKESNKKV